MKNNRSYSIVIRYEGDTTTATLIDSNFKHIKTTTAKRNPKDKPSLRIGAQVAFDRLWQKKEKPEDPAEKDGFKVGDRVVCVNRSHECCDKHGRIVAILHDTDLVPFGVEFDECVYGHDCDGAAKLGYGRWFFASDLSHEQPTKPQVREVKRNAKVGEWVRIVDALHGYGEKYKNGDVLRTVVVDCLGFADLSCGGAGAYPGEYVALEGYQPEEK